jgi:hypothetical protein
LLIFVSCFLRATVPKICSDCTFGAHLFIQCTVHTTGNM